MLRGLCYSRALIIFRGDDLGTLRKLQQEAPKSPRRVQRLTLMAPNIVEVIPGEWQPA